MADQQTADHQAVMQVIETETNAFWLKDYELWATCWLQSPAIHREGWWARGGIRFTQGWQALSESVKQSMLDNPTPNPTATLVRRENVRIRVSSDGQMAWVTFDQYGEDTGEPDMDMPGLSHETRILEKHDGAWKIVYVCWLLRGE